MYLILILLSIAVHSVHSQQPSDYTRNSVYYAGQIMPTVPSTEQSSQDVLKELGVDLSNEGRPISNIILNFIVLFRTFIRTSFFSLVCLKFNAKCKILYSIWNIRGENPFLKSAIAPWALLRICFVVFLTSFKKHVNLHHVLQTKKEVHI